MKCTQSQSKCGAHQQRQIQTEASSSTFPEIERMRIPRSIEEAFGPYARGPVYVPKEKMPIADKVLIASGVVAVVGVVAVIAFSY